MRPELFHDTITFDDALRVALAHAAPIGKTERVRLADAVGRVSAATVESRIDVPPFDRSAMDGFAVRAEDLDHPEHGRPRRLHLDGQVFTGDSPTSSPLAPGTCREIATGAPLPPAATAVVMVERTSRDGDAIHFTESPTPGQNIGRRGSDIAQGQAALRAGDYITPARAGALAAVGAHDAEVFAQPTVTIFSTGSEVAAMGTTLRPGQVHDVNTTTLEAVVNQHGGRAHVLPPVADTLDELERSLRSAASSDLVICSGGSSVGRRDLLTDALARCGRTVFHGIAVKPGKPTLFGFVGTTPLFGMPGNPTSCLSNAYLLVVPFLRTLARLPAWRPTRLQLPLARRIVSNANRHQFFTVRLDGGEAVPAFKSSGDITSMAEADGYVEIPAEVSTVEAGTLVTVVLF